MATILKGKTFINRFDPSLVSGLQLWLDASDSTTLFQDSAATTPAVADGDPIGCWKDKSGYARNATQTDNTRKPVLTKNFINLRNTVNFSTNDLLTISTNMLSNKTTYTMFFVVRTNTLGDPYQDVFLSTDDSFFVEATSLGGLFWGRLDSIEYRTYSTANDFFTASTMTVFSLRQTGVTTGEAKSYNTVRSSYSGTLGDHYTSSTIYLGNYLSSVRRPLYGYICEIIIYDYAISSDNVTLATNFLMRKWNLP